ncbi:MAG: alanyl-tRNA editing protein [Candidatus Bathyarchaeia archaeon]
MPSTRLLYWEDSYLRGFKGLILKAEPDEKRFYYLVLDRTAFHPKIGGQPSDRGVIQAPGFRLEVRKVMQVKDVLVHWGRAAEGGPPAGQVQGEIDWAWRYLLMRRHTAGHLLDHCLGVAVGRNMETLGSWLGEGCYVEYRGALPHTSLLREAEELERRMIAEGAEVTAELISKEELLKRAPEAPNIYRLPPLETYRIVTIRGCLPIPCSGTHLKNISEIGGFHIGTAKPVQEGFRVYYDVES